jgi:amino acid adenylation domain-containing protein
MGRWLVMGELEYLGRIDQQVKIRGYRIELAEIEGRLLEIEPVKEAVVLARQDNSGDKYLCAYIVGEGTAPGTIRRRLAEKLPDYMIPGYFVKLDHIPLTANGKVDRGALPEPGREEYDGELKDAPRGETEKRLAQIWAGALQVPVLNVGRHDSFFNLGGDSIKAIRLVNQVNVEMSADVKIADLYIHDTVEKLAKQVSGHGTIYTNQELETVFHELEALKQEILARDKLPAGIQDIYPMSDIEKGMLFHSLKDANAAMYHDQFVFQAVYRDFDAQRFRKALAVLTDKHPVLRTSFMMDDFSEPMQAVYEKIELDFQFHDLSAMDRAEHENYINEIIRADRGKPFDFKVPPLWRMRVFDRGGDNIVLLWIFHHAILDGWSSASFIAELDDTYQQLESDPGFIPPPLKSSYKEFAAEQILEKRKPANIDFWKAELAGYKRLDFAGILNRAPGRDTMEVVSRDLGKEMLTGLRQTASEKKSTIKNLCFAAYVYMLAMLSYENDLVVGLVTNNRPVCEDGDSILGCFLNTIPVRITVPTGMTWSEYIDGVEQTLLRLKPFERFPFAEIALLTGDAPGRRNRVYDTFFNYIDLYVYERVSRGVDRQGRDRLSLDGHENSNTLLDLTINTTFSQFVFYLSYSTSIIDGHTALALFYYFERILKKFIHEPGGIAAKDEILPPEEKQRLLVEFNGGRVDKTNGKTVLRLFEDRAARNGDGVCVVYHDEHLTRGELDKQATQSAYRLREKGMKPGGTASVPADHSPAMIIAVLGIWKAGCAYLPIDAGSPAKRVRYMLEDSRADAVTGGGLNGPGGSLAYVIYTSGTTGKPRGVLLSHENLANYVAWFSGAAGITPADRTMLVSSFGFDLGYTAVYPCLAHGGQLHVVPAGIYKSPLHLGDYIHTRCITYLKMTPSLFSTLVDPAVLSPGKFRALRLVALGGEAINPVDVQRLHACCPHTRVMNHYGPTESTVGSVACFIDFAAWEDYEKYPVIGQPITNTRVFILDRDSMPLPVGVPGELCIAGSGLALGYLNNPGLTAGKFVRISHRSYMSYRTHIPGKIYKTGDMARWMPDGNIMFLGRLEQQRQLKIRGYRVESAEIEARLSVHPRVKEAVVIAAHDSICAYIVAARPCSPEELENFLREDLPGYMVPAYFIFIDKIPLTANGKLDRQALPGPGIIKGERHIEPRDELERELAAIWEQVLGREGEPGERTIGIDDDFFQLGGHSLKAALATMRIHKRLNREIPLAQLFAAPTIRGLAAYIRTGDSGGRVFTPIEAAEEREYYPLAPAQRGLYIHQRLNRQGTAYNGLRAVTIDGELRREQLETALMKVIDRHDSLRTSFPTIDGQPVQRVHEEAAFAIEYYDFCPGAGDKEISEVGNSFVRPFDLTEPPLLRVGLVKVEKNRHILLIDMHHIITDGVSHYIFVSELIALYGGEEPGRPGPRLQYGDYAVWLNSPGVRRALEKQEAFWLKRFAGSIPRLRLPYDYKRTAVRSFRGGSLTVEAGAQLTARLRDLAETTGTTLFMVLLTAYNILLWKYTGQEDIVVGSPITGRNHTDLQQVIGMFVNMLALRSRPRAGKTAGEFLLEVKESVLGSMENSDYHFEELAAALGLQGDRGRNPLFDVVFAMNNHEFVDMENRDFSAGNGNSLRVSGYDAQQNISRFDLLTGAFEHTRAETGERTLRLVLEYDAGLFKPVFAERFLSHYMAVLEQLARPDNRFTLADIDIAYGLLAADAGAPARQNEELEFDF